MMQKQLSQELKRSVPVWELENLIQRYDQDWSLASRTKDELIEKINSILSATPVARETIYDLVDRYKIADRGATSWSVPLEKKDLTQAEIEYLIKKKFDKDPFKQDLKPEVTNRPSLNKAEWIHEKTLKLDFVYLGKSYQIEEDYEYKTVTPTKRASAFIKILEKSFVVEGKVGFHIAQRLHTIIADLLEVETLVISFSKLEIDKIKELLNARKKFAKHKKVAGDFDVVSVTAAHTVEDLDHSDEYRNYLSADDVKEVKCAFKYQKHDGSFLEVTIHISSTGSIWFLTGVPNEILNYVFSIIRRVKGF
jgi:hypothetical protein